LAFFLYLRTKGELKNKEQFNSRISYGNVLYGVIPFFIFQYFIIAGTSMSIDNRANIVAFSEVLSAGGIFTIASLSFFYYKSLKNIKTERNKRMAFYNTFLLRIIILTVSSLIGLIVVMFASNVSLFQVLSFTIPVRISGEFFLKKRFLTK
jgi:hypothetical protein